jgi:hypothetical protein
MIPIWTWDTLWVCFLTFNVNPKGPELYAWGIAPRGLCQELKKLQVGSKNSQWVCNSTTLQGLHQQIKNDHDHKHAVYWVISCLILHNLVLGIEGHFDSKDLFNLELLQEGLEGESTWQDDDVLDSYVSDEKFLDAGAMVRFWSGFLTLMQNLSVT